MGAILGYALAAPSELVAPEPVEDTAEVAAAKAEFAAAYEAQVAAVEAGVLPEVINPVGAPESVVDIDEVAEAKAELNAVLKAAGDDSVIEVGEYKAVAPITYAAGLAHPLAYHAAGVAHPLTYTTGVAPLTYSAAGVAAPAAIAPLNYAHIAPVAVLPQGVVHPFGFAHAGLVL